MENKNWVDIHDEATMISLGIHLPYRTPKDPSVWTKTKQERRALRKVKRKSRMHMNAIPSKSIPVQAKMIVQLKKNKRFTYTTYSTICYMHQIDTIIDFYGAKNIAHYNYNGKNYSVSERPFWY